MNHMTLKPKKPTSRRLAAGYALLMTLVLLSVVAVAMTSVARTVTQQSVDVVKAQEDLQLRWGQLTCRQVFLPMAEDAIAAAEEERGQATAWVISPAFKLGNTQIVIALSDEQARANINTLHENAGLQDTEVILRESLAPALVDRLHLQPMPAPPLPAKQNESDQPSPPPLRYLALGQVFSGQPLADSDNKQHKWDTESSVDAGPIIQLPLTCWGDGRINARRANRQTLAMAVGDLLSQNDIEQLLRLREDRPGLGITEMIAQLGLAHDDHKPLMARLRDDSGCYGLWILADTGKRHHLSLTVTEDATEDQASRIRRFLW